MGRGRIPMELIEKEKARKTTFHKRKSGLMKKVYEFSTLCAVDVAVIIYAPKFLDEPETWPQDSREVKRVIQKFQNTTNDRRPKVYDVQEYFNDRMKKIEGEISKVNKENIKILYPAKEEWYNNLTEEQLRMFVSKLDAKLDACSQRMNMLKRDTKGKAKVESDNAETITPYMASNLGSDHYLNFMQNMSQVQLFPPTKSNGDNNQVPCYHPFQFSQSSQPSMFHFGQNYAMVDWANNQVGPVACDSKMSIPKEQGYEKNQNSSSCYYNGDMQTMQPYNFALPTLPSQLGHNVNFHTLPDPSVPPPGFGFNDFYDSNSNMLQPLFFNYMHGRK